VGHQVLGKAVHATAGAGDLREALRLRSPPVYQAGLIADFFSWPGGGGNLNYPKVFNEGLASILKDVKERQMALEMRQPNTSKLYFYEPARSS